MENDSVLAESPKMNLSYFPFIHGIDRLKVTRSTQIVIACVIASTFLGHVGCNSSADVAQISEDLPGPQAETAASNNDAARRLLERVIQNYRTTAQYSDRGRVILRYNQAGIEHQDEAPLSLAFIRNRNLHLTAYASELAIYQGRMRATIVDPMTMNMGGQMLDLPLLEPSFGLKEIYSDPTFVHFSTVGLGGPSPQLELLLSDDPLAGLFQGESRISLIEPSTMGSSLCDRLAIQSNALQYMLWIDRETLVIRRVELPTSGTELASDPSVSSIRLSIELDEAKMSVSADETWRLARPNDALAVRQFVLPPPEIISENLGRQLQTFQLRDSHNEFTVTENGSDRATTVLLWIADHPASRAAAAQLQIIADQRDLASNRNVRFLLVMAEPTPPPSNATAELLRSWNIGLSFCNDYQAVGRDVFGVHEAPSLCILGKQGELQWFAPRVGPEMGGDLPAILADLEKGVNIGGDIATRYSQDQETYRRLLVEARQAPVEKL